jgi:rhodanese-related sulfurtransferase
MERHAPMEHLEPKAAYAFLQHDAQAVFIDCRSEMEYLFVGHPVGAITVPWYDGPEWERNPHFVGQVKKLAGANFEHRPIVLICRSGNRTLQAAHALEGAGFKRVVNVVHGFEGDLDENHHRNTRNGWRVDGLPWKQY